MTRKELLKPRVIDCVDRLRKLIDIDAPPVIIGAEIWLLFRTALAAYGEKIGQRMIHSLTEQALHSRGVCSMNECTNPVDRAGLSVCESCGAELDKLIEEGDDEPDLRHTDLKDDDRRDRGEV